MDKISNDWGDLALLGIDIEKHREVLAAFRKLSLDPLSILPTLRAREMAVGEYAGMSIYVAAASSEQALRDAFETDTIVSVEPIAHASSAEEASRICAETIRYFMRHFPGRYLASVSAESGKGATVFTMFTTPR